MRLTGISRRKLSYWLDTGIVSAEIDAAKGRGRVRLYSFRNLVEIRTAMWLRDKVSLQLIRKIIVRLGALLESESPLVDVAFGILETGRKRDPFRVAIKCEDGAWEHWESGQLIMEIAIPIGSMAEHLSRAAERDRRSRRRSGHIERRRGVLGSAPVLAGTRIPTRAIWSLHEAGYDTARILANYRGLTAADVKAALDHERGRRRQSA